VPTTAKPNPTRRRQAGERARHVSSPTCGALGLFVLLGVVCGCRLPGYEGPSSRSVVTCRQLSQRAAAAIDRNDWAAAETLLVEATKTCPVDTDAKRLYADALWHRGASGEAVAQIEEAARRTADDASLRIRLAEMRLEMGQLEAARRAADDAVAIDPRSACAWTVRGRVSRRSGDSRQALADFHRALSVDSSHTPALLELADLYLELGQPQRALSNVQGALDGYSPGDEPQSCLYLAGLAYTRMARYDEAIESLRSAAARGRATPEILCRLAEAEMLSGRGEEARRTVGQALALDPHNRLGRMLLERVAASEDRARTR
jgi:tetratricopeptide (TPR) repeat protein